MFESRRADDADQLLPHVAIVEVFEKDEIILFAFDGYEIEVQRFCGGLDAKAGIDVSTGDRNGHVRGVFAFVSLNLFWFDLEFAEFVIKQDTSTRSGLTVDEGDVFTREVFDAFDLLR